MPLTYQPRYRVTGQSTWINFGSPITVAPFTVTVTGLSAGVQYDFDVQAINTFGSTASATVTATTSGSSVTESTEGTTITASNETTQFIYDANLLQWSLTSGGQVATSPSPYTTKTPVSGTSGVTKVLFHNATVFYENSSFDWFYWTGSAFTATLDITGPMTIGGSSSPTFTVGSSGLSLGAIALTTVGVPAFSGSYAIAGTDSAYFTITSGNLVTTQTTSARTYSINITATQSNVVGSPFTQSFNIIGSAQTESIEGYTVTTAGPIVYASETMGVADSAGPWNQFSLVADSGSPPYSIVEAGGGTAGTGGGNVVALVYHNHTLYQHATDSSTFNGWWYWDTATSAYVFFAISSVNLSNSSVATSSPAGTVVGTLSTVMSDSSTFSGTYSVSDTTNFKIVGSSLETNVANLSGSFSIIITATPSVVGNALATNETITAGTSAFPNNPPPQAVAAGFTTLSFFDDFTTNTIDPTAGVTTLQTGINWYSSHSAGMSTPTNYKLETGTHASGIANGDNGTGGSNASPNGGIVRIYGTPPGVQQNQSTFQGIPQALIASGYQGSQVYGPTGYFEAYMQYNPALGTEHIGFWWNPNILNSSLQATECDVVEQGAAAFGNSNWQLGQLNQWTGNSPNSVDYPYSSLNDTVASDAQWHTFGMLIQFNSGSTTVGTMSIYFDNVLKGSRAVGAGTGYPSIFFAKRILLAGKDWGAGNGNAIIFDWFRYWS